MLTDDYIDYVASVRRYSPRTCDIYSDSLRQFCEYLTGPGGPVEPAQSAISPATQSADQSAAQSTDRSAVPEISDSDFLDCLKSTIIRSYEVWLLDDRKLVPRTVNLHLSVLSGMCRFLVKQGLLASNPVRAVTRPKEEKRLPEFYRKESMDAYFAATEYIIAEDMIYTSPDIKQTQQRYEARLRRAIVSTLYNTGMRRAELICLKVGSVDFSRKVANVLGKGEKMREIPLVPALLKEISLYLQAVDAMVGGDRSSASPLFVTFRGKGIYPEYVDRAVKRELGDVAGITGRRSPHVLRHTLATELLDSGTDLNSIKELLGHSSLAATQVYTHNSIAKLKKVYESAHPRARKNGGKNGD